MKHLLSQALIATAVLLVLGGGRVRAEMLDFTYSWSITPDVVLPSGTGNVSLTLTPDGSSSVEVGGSQVVIPAATVTTNSSATDLPDVFNAPYSMTLHFTDALGNTGDLTFNGVVAGELTATTSTLTSTFNDPVIQTLTFGDLTYTVAIDPVLTALPAPGAASAVLLDAFITAVRDGPQPPLDTPEPSSLVLGGSALLLLGLARRRLRRKRH